MECSKGHFTYEELYGQVEYVIYRVVNGVAYYQDMAFLTWISKHKKNILQATHGSFLSIHKSLMETY